MGQLFSGTRGVCVARDVFRLFKARALAVFVRSRFGPWENLPVEKSRVGPFDDEHM